METIQLIIDNKEVEVPRGTTILDAAKSVGIHIPTLCYMKLEDLHYENNPGACRICVVEIEEMAGWEGAKLNEAKDILAYELTKLVHGDEEADKARQASKALFSGAGDAAHMPTTELTNDDLGGGQINILNLMVRCGLCASKGEARRLVQQGGVSVNDEKVKSLDFSLSADEIAADPAIIKKGKKIFHKIVMA